MFAAAMLGILVTMFLALVAAVRGPTRHQPLNRQALLKPKVLVLFGGMNLVFRICSMS